MELMLDGRVAIVTGAGQGAGAAIAQALAAAGARVTVNDINPDRADRVAAGIVAQGGQAISIQADVANKFQCVKLIENTRAEWQSLDILVNQAHVVPSSTILKMDEWDWNRCLEVNLKGVFFMSQLCGRVMSDRRSGGTIINVVSPAGIRGPLPNHAAFCASQAAVLGFARECAREYTDYGIDVSTLVADGGEGIEAPAAADGADVARAVLHLCTRSRDRESGAVLELSSFLAST
jgi:NAD(P)-dependent dehydrogenase (short-subunit alcohol dehydrogenase family)